MKIHSRDRRAVKLTLVLLLTESVLCQEKWSFSDEELDKSKSEELDVWWKKGTVGDGQDLSNDECCFRENSDKVSTLKKEFNTLEIAKYDKLEGECAGAKIKEDETSVGFQINPPKLNPSERSNDHNNLCTPNTVLHMIKSIDPYICKIENKGQNCENDKGIIKKRSLQSPYELEDEADYVDYDDEENKTGNFSEKIRRDNKSPKVEVRANAWRNINDEKTKKGPLVKRTIEENQTLTLTTNSNISSTEAYPTLTKIDESKMTIIMNKSNPNQMRIAIIDDPNDMTTVYFKSPSKHQQLNVTTETSPEQTDKTWFKRDKNYRSLSTNSTSNDDIESDWDKYVLGLEGNETQEDIDQRIIGGRITPIDNVPYLVVIQRKKRHICGGTIISNHHVLTAAHCVTIPGSEYTNIRYTILSPIHYSIRYGSNHSEYGGRVVPVGRFYVHPEYLISSKYNIYMDLAVIWIPIRIDLSVAKIATLPKSQLKRETYMNVTKEGKKCIVAGWGATRGYRRVKRAALLGTNLTLFDIQKCAEKYLQHGYGISEKAHICTYTDDKDACKGDSGGGLYCDNMIWGVTSWGIGCAKKDIPGVFARVDTNLRFIKSAIYQDESGVARLQSNSPEKQIYVDIYILNLALSLFITIKILISKLFI